MKDAGVMAIYTAIAVVIVAIVAVFAGLAVDCNRRGGVLVETPFGCECVRRMP